MRPSRSRRGRPRWPRRCSKGSSRLPSWQETTSTCSKAEPRMTDLNDPAVTRAAQYDTATLSDALDRLGILGQCAHLRPCDRAFRMIGRAFTILYGPAAKPAGTVG